MALWLYLHFPALQLDAMLSQNGASQNKDFQDEASQNKTPQEPLAIVDEQQNSLVQVNDSAAEQGVTVGMGLAAAATLCRDLQLVPYRRELGVGKLREIAHWLYDVSADIVLWEPSGLLLRVSRMLKFYRGLAPYWQTVQEQLKQLPYRFAYATGYSPLAARLLATTGAQQVTDDRHWLRQQCARRAIGQTDLSPAQQEKLVRLGITQLADLLAIPLKELSRRFSIDALQYVGQLTGDLKQPVVFHHPPENFQHYLELLYEIENTEVLQHPMKHQLVLLENFLRRRDQVCSRICFRLHQRNGVPLVVSVGSAQGEDRANQWLELSRLTLEKYQLEAPVFALTLEVDAFQNREAQSTDLFAGRQGKLSDRQLVSLLQARLGSEAVTGLTREDDFRPEFASALCPALAPRKSPENSALLRPSLLLAEPQVLTEPVAIVHGPERIATGWWDHHPLVRDYYIARNHKGQWYWVFRTPAQVDTRQQWYLHGYFS